MRGRWGIPTIFRRGVDAAPRKWYSAIQKTRGYAGYFGLFCLFAVKQEEGKAFRTVRAHVRRYRYAK